MNKVKNTNTRIPQSLLMKLFDFTGSASGGNKGFFLFYVNEFGEPTIVSKTENPCVDMALSKLVEMSFNEVIDQ